MTGPVTVKVGSVSGWAPSPSVEERQINAIPGNRNSRLRRLSDHPRSWSDGGQRNQATVPGFLMRRELTERAETDGSGLRAQFVSLKDRLQRSVIGQDRAIEHLLIALLADGHVLLEGAPGLAKTRIARILAQFVEGEFKRIQFTPDLLPSDLTGAPIYLPQEHRFEFQKGPIFGNFILADEINRAPAKVQSALLEAMEERQVTSAVTSYPLEDPFFVIATQNPIEHEGTWDLPQAQLDRFLMYIGIDYPSAGVERGILELVMNETVESFAPEGPDPDAPPIAKADLRSARQEVVAVHVSDFIQDYIVRLVSGTRDDPRPLPGVGEHLSHPISPRGSITLARTAQARAWMAGRDHVLPEDIAALALDVLRHRIGLTYRAEADGVQPEAIIKALLDQVDVV